MNTKMILSTAGSALVLALMTPGQATAQDAPAVADGDKAEAIVVTGSRIQRRDFVAPSPIVTVGAEAIQASGRASVDDYLKDLPQFTPGTGSFSNDSNGGTAGRATLNLRGLGPQRNLVLLDGRRLMSSGTDGAIDINTVPSLAIGGIEVISGGASATYGSDALSGVVNFKLRTDLDGFDVRVQHATLSQPGDATTQLGGAFGKRFADGKGRLLLSAEYLDRGGVRFNQRDFFLNPGLSSFIPQGRFRIGSTFLSVNDDGSIFNPTTGANYKGPNTLPFLRGDPATNTGAVGYHGSYYNYLQVPLTRTALFGKLEYEVAPDTTVYAQGSFTSSKASNIGSEPNFGGAPWALTIPATNPFLVAVRAANPGQFGTGPISVFQARVTQVGPRVYQTRNQTYQLLLGATGKLTADISWDVHASYGHARNEDRTLSGAVSVSALQRLLNAADGGNSLCAGGYNPFRGLSPLSSACIGYVARTPLNETTLDQFVLEGNVEGGLFRLPAGEARFAVTAQYRSNTYGFNPDPDLAAADLANLSAALPTRGTIRAKEAGLELFLPLIANSPVAQSVNLTLGYRLSNYNLSGSNSTYKAELDARINRVVLLRGGYQHALRAPNVGEYFQAGETRVVAIGAPPAAGDPCDRRSTPTGDRLLLCQAQGVPANYQAPAQSTPAVTRGNPGLTPEKADSYTAGIVFDVPLGGSKLQLSADWYAIRIKDAIAPIAAADSLQQCYNVTGSTTGFNAASYLANNFFCKLFARTVSGDLTIIEQPIRNLGSLKTSGLDFAANLRVPAPFLGWGGRDGAISLSSNVNYQIDYKLQTFATSPELDYAGTIAGDPTQSFPRWRGITTVGLRSGPVNLTGTWRYISAMADRSAAANPATTVRGTPAYSYFDLNARLDVTRLIELFGGITNIANKAPPVVGGTAATTNLGTYDAIGRTFFFGARARF